MLYYGSKFELVRQLFDLFVNTLVGQQVYPYSGSGHEVLQFLDQHISTAISEGLLPATYLSFDSDQDTTINAYQNSIIALADQMAVDAKQFNPIDPQMHEWSLGRAIRKLCPLFPFLRQQCDQYNYLDRWTF
jgi:hypothetical protein